MHQPKCCPLEILLSQISGQWTLYLIWVLDSKGALRFGELRRNVDGISTKMLTERLRLLESLELVHRHYEPTIPPQVTYSLTERGKQLSRTLDPIYDLALSWYGNGELPKQAGSG